MTLGQVIDQLPKRVPPKRAGEEGEADNYEADEVFVQKFYGKAAHLFTEEMALRLRYLPLMTFCALQGQRWSFEGIYDRGNLAVRARNIGILELVDVYDPAMTTLTVRNVSDGGCTFDLYVGGGHHLGSGSGYDPVYLFF